MKWLQLFAVLIITSGIWMFTNISLDWGEDIAQAQGNVEVIKTLNRNSNVVRVGEILTFTIAVTNNSNFTLTNVTLVDDYDNTTLAYVGANPNESQHDQSTATITWDNVAAPPIPPGGSVFVTVMFIAEHPKPAVVNHARGEDIISNQGQSLITATDSISNEAIGGAAPVYKSISPPGAVGVAGSRITFTQVITNDGAAILTFLPLSDTFDTNFLQFHYAIPNPAYIDQNNPISHTLVWTDLTTYFGPLDPFEVITVTTVFTALTPITGTVNQASTKGARDQYNNDLAAGEGLVPIIIVPAPTNTPATEPTPKPKPTSKATDTPAPIPTATFTPAPTLTPTPIVIATVPYPTVLPETGLQILTQLWLFLAGIGLLGLGGLFIYFKQS